MQSRYDPLARYGKLLFLLPKAILRQERHVAAISDFRINQIRYRTNVSDLQCSDVIIRIFREKYALYRCSTVPILTFTGGILIKCIKKISS